MVAMSLITALIYCFIRVCLRLEQNSPSTGFIDILGLFALTKDKRGDFNFPTISYLILRSNISSERR